MNVRLETSVDFIAGIVVNNSPVILNQYFVDISLMTNTENPADHNIAFERLNYFMNDVLPSSVFVFEGNEDKIKELQKAVVKVVALPYEPYDQIIGRMIFVKLSAIMEDKMFVTDVSISSAHGKHLKYLHAAEEGTEPFDVDGWWNDPSPSYCDKKFGKKEKVVKIEKSLSWKDLSLDWDDEEDWDEGEGERTVIVKFDSDE